MNNTKVDEDIKRIKEDIKRDEEKKAKLELNRSVIDEKIKGLNRSISDKKKIIAQKQFSVINNVITGNGLTVEELLSAVQNGDFLSLQEKLEAIKTDSN